MGIESFEGALINAYVKDPCRILPNALWKTLQQINNFDYAFTTKNNEVKSIKLLNEDMLYIYWQDDNSDINLDESYLNNIKTALVHKTQLSKGLKDKFSSADSYFRLLHDISSIEAVDIPKGYYFRNVNAKNEIQMVSNFICCCYDEIKPSSEEVLKWTNHPVFSENLWLWIIDEETEKPAALGIAELDRSIKEGSLEWIQVLPDYQGKGLGTALVMKLLNRLKPRADFITVSGETNNKTNPEKLYRGCGFYGDDIWYVLRK